MPAQTWDEILAEAKLSPDEKKLFDIVVQRVPEFKDGRLRQADYTRQMNEFTKTKKEAEDAISVRDRVQTWFEERKPTWDTLVAAGAVDIDGEPIWPKEKDRLTKELEAAKKAAVAGADMDPKELDERVRAIVTAAGGVTREELTALVASEAAKMAEEKVEAKYKQFEVQFNEKTIPFVSGFGASNSLAAIDYEKITGEEFTEEKQAELFTFMTKEKIMNPRKAMAEFLKPAIKAKADEAEVERRADEKARKMVADRGEVLGDQPFIPLPTEQARGSLQKMLEDSAAAEGDLETLVMAESRKAAAELRAEGKGR